MFARNLQKVLFSKMPSPNCRPVNVHLTENSVKPLLSSGMHVSAYSEEEDEKERLSRWLRHNQTIYPPTKEGEEKRLAFVCHEKKNIKYSLKKMWYIACFVRGLSVDEACKQLDFLCKKGAVAVKETILEAQKMAVEDHNVEHKTNLWVAESFSTKGYVIKGVRRHAKGRPGEIRYMYVNYYVRLEEGKPPKHYYLPHPISAQQQLDDYISSLRKRKIQNSL